MILEFDLGNSRIKWRILDIEGGSAGQGIAEDVGELDEMLKDHAHIDFIRLCAVRKGDALDRLLEWCRASYSCDVSVAKVESQCGQVSNQYRDPKKLGVDRWVAMLAAFERVQSACIVVDGGTALTVDILSGDGAHEGGYILPGLTMMQESLVQNTAIRLSSEQHIPSVRPGHSTDQAVLQGVLAAMIALIEKVSRSHLQHAKKPMILLTGGDAITLENALLFEQSSSQAKIECEVVPDLVLDGLAIVCPFDEKNLTQ